MLSLLHEIHNGVGVTRAHIVVYRYSFDRLFFVIAEPDWMYIFKMHETYIT